MLSLVALALVLGSCPIGIFATEAGDILAGEHSVCWEAHTPDWLCHGYESVGYTCVVARFEADNLGAFRTMFHSREGKPLFTDVDVDGVDESSTRALTDGA